MLILIEHAVLVAAVIAAVWGLAGTRTGRAFCRWIWPGWRGFWLHLAIWGLAWAVAWSLFDVAWYWGERSGEAAAERTAKGK